MPFHLINFYSNNFSRDIRIKGADLAEDLSFAQLDELLKQESGGKNDQSLSSVLNTRSYSCIDIYAHSCLKPFSIGPKAVLKQQNPCLNHEIHVRFEHGFRLKSVDVIGQCDMMSLQVFHRNKMANGRC